MTSGGFSRQARWAMRMDSSKSLSGRTGSTTSKPCSRRKVDLKPPGFDPRPSRKRSFMGVVLLSPLRHERRIIPDRLQALVKSQTGEEFDPLAGVPLVVEAEPPASRVLASAEAVS